MDKVGNFNCQRKGEKKAICYYEDLNNEVSEKASLIVKINNKKIFDNKFVVYIYTFGNKLEGNLATAKITLRRIKRNLILRYNKLFGYQLIKTNE